MDMIKSAFACYKFVAKQLLHLIFSSGIESGIFLTEWKMANVVPVHQGDDKQNVQKHLNVLYKVICIHFLLKMI